MFEDIREIKEKLQFDGIVCDITTLEGLTLFRIVEHGIEKLSFQGYLFREGELVPLDCGEKCKDIPICLELAKKQVKEGDILIIKRYCRGGDKEEMFFYKKISAKEAEIAAKLYTSLIPVF